MRDALIYSAVRTPVGKYGGALATVRPDDLAAVVIRGAVERAGIEPAAIDDVILGCSIGAGEDSRNIARLAALLAGLPIEVPGVTVNRLCGSGTQAVSYAHQAIAANEGSIFVCGGVESMTRAPFVMLKPAQAFERTPPELADSALGWRFTNPRFNREWTIPLWGTAENIARRYGISREEQDRFAFESQRRARDAIAAGVFTDELVPVTVDAKRNKATCVSVDEHPRETSYESLAGLKPAFRPDGTLTAGNVSGISDGAAALVVAAHGMAGAKPFARVVGAAAAGVDPAYMGLGPIPATRKLLKRFGLTCADLDLVELNEAFASKAIACIRELELDPARVNVYGGAIALGHPIGCTTAKMLVTLVHALRRRNGRYGLVTAGIGVGQGHSLLVESILD